MSTNNGKLVQIINKFNSLTFHPEKIFVHRWSTHLISLAPIIPLKHKRIIECGDRFFWQEFFQREVVTGDIAGAVPQESGVLVPHDSIVPDVFRVADQHGEADFDAEGVIVEVDCFGHFCCRSFKKRRVHLYPGPVLILLAPRMSVVRVPRSLTLFINIFLK